MTAPNPDLTGIENILGLVNKSNPNAALTTQNVSVTINPSNTLATSVNILSIEDMGYTGSISVSYDRLDLNTKLNPTPIFVTDEDLEDQVAVEGWLVTRLKEHGVVTLRDNLTNELSYEFSGNSLTLDGTQLMSVTITPSVTEGRSSIYLGEHTQTLSRVTLNASTRKVVGSNLIRVTPSGQVRRIAGS